MADVVENLLFVATGIPHPCRASPCAELVWEIIVRELSPLIATFPESALCSAQLKRQSTSGHILPIIRFLARNNGALRRFIARMAVNDAVQQHVCEGDLEEVSAPVEKRAGARIAAVKEALTELNWPYDTVAEYLMQPKECPVKRARLVRADRVTQAMDPATYQAFCEARTVSFIPQKAPKKRNFNGHWLSGMTKDLEMLSHTVEQDLAYLAGEIVSAVADLVLVLRADQRDGTHLRYAILRVEGDTQQLAEVWACLREEKFVSVITAEEVLNVARIFCTNFSSRDSGPNCLLLTV
ncbi:hypothetical protein BV898_02635 [Hypsibius exemplaris]|uniref:Uncharacterized protein n=1 Tax=Hypsibius exemplaris TaxID=2072580 RepID=A0A1W0X7Y8_HYPEX|nr:hypothetical protein BV898_02635 [Hypsibius exemplaris]